MLSVILTRVPHGPPAVSLLPGEHPIARDVKSKKATLVVPALLIDKVSKDPTPASCHCAVCAVCAMPTDWKSTKTPTPTLCRSASCAVRASQYDRKSAKEANTHITLAMLCVPASMMSRVTQKPITGS